MDWRASRRTALSGCSRACFCEQSPGEYQTTNPEIQIQKVRPHNVDGVLLHQRIHQDALSPRRRLLLQQAIHQPARLLQQQTSVEALLLHPGLHDRRVQPPLLAVRVDDVVADQAGNHRPGDLDLAAGFSVQLLVAEHVRQEVGAGDEDAPLAGEPEQRGAVVLQGLAQPALVDFVLAHGAPEAQDGDVEGDARESGEVEGDVEIPPEEREEDEGDC